MITYPDANLAEITHRVAAQQPKWAAKAAIEHAAVIAAGRFTPPKAPKGQPKAKAPPSIWADVKPIYMELQHYKCIFCERGLAHAEGSIEHDVEHYRPKNAIVRWQPVGFPLVPHQAGPAATSGYYWLAYDLENYAAACKPCNSTRKRSFFPVQGTRGAALATIADLNTGEEPLVIFPMYEDPASLITFLGVAAMPVAVDGLDHLRARVTIELFNLNGREELISERFAVIRSLVSAFELVVTGSTQAKRDDGLKQISELTAASASHSACAKAFLAELEKDPVKAWDVYQDARAYVEEAARRA